jgi:hypothetical protein
MTIFMIKLDLSLEWKSGSHMQIHKGDAPPKRMNHKIYVMISFDTE